MFDLLLYLIQSLMRTDTIGLDERPLTKDVNDTDKVQSGQNG